MKLRAKLLIFGIILGSLLIPAYFILQTYGVFQKERVLSDYVLAVDVNREPYDAWPLVNSFAAMDKSEDNRQLYYRVDMNHINYLFQLAYQEYGVTPGNENPFLAGNVEYHSPETTYVRSEKEYSNAKDYTTSLHFYNKEEQEIYTYETTGKGDGNLVKSIIHQGMTRSHNGGSEAARDPYINITALFHDKLNVDVNLTVDEEQKIVWIRMNKAEAR
ncbi:hypothetical protein [Paenibacillus xylanilyticus]|uniref:Uncharacterized protein n=1 Tax=Paenibacillus xylanilyticus TaxID=248903 RepID=A0A7Y6EVJ9_9BACL|nr:hypothetical protein [Paenibacillus xylanilyticus]NUU78337.1 hypothetical protein [Paenibacillus xylanilyticus]